MKYTEKITDHLNDVLKKSFDAEQEYLTAAENVDTIELKRYFEKRASERSEFSKKLQSEIETYGASPKDNTSFKADAHRVWMNFRAALSSNNEETILKEIIRGEEAALEEYNEVMKEHTLPKSTYDLLMKQRSTISNALEEAKNFEMIEA
ncbi:PA2169 family four-helix-bundle protein [Aquimarina sp. U1-2]|uniref:ferritin-like domain-containing protein n=1 Tax=Aquimarina sp. U1-2 TaxID=2823141 RepID=UPI001AECE201|nr:PA2169 family four-helix-bundle protein [Aquimarina sp. U1-2]MBP2831740.1 PA2169 family four-helix-bundle protein [Aquimarina sp. U1-2]